MSALAPPVPLEGHCSVLHDNTLYVYSPQAFLSLPLKLDGKWTKLPMGKSVTGGACIKGGMDGNNNRSALYVVGGKSDSPDYRGLQRYSFEDQKWESLNTVTLDIQNRVNHGAAYLNASSSILVYAGTQRGDQNPSSQTFLVSAVPPYNVQSFNSFIPPALDPYLFPWGEDKAAMLGGGPYNTKVFSFAPAFGWQDTGCTLLQALPDKSKAQCAMVNGNDGSRVLEIFNMSTSPNTVTRFVLLQAGGLPAPAGQQIGAAPSPTPSQPPRPPPAKKQKREILLTNYPPYNGTLAPTVIRNGFSLAQDSNGLVAVSGGSDEDPLCLFDQSANRWINTTQLLIGKESKATTASGTVSASLPTISSSASGSSTTDGTSHRRALTIVGATLGAILGLAAVIIMILLLLGWRKRRNQYMRRGKDRFRSEDKDRLSFQDQGMEPLTRAGQPMARGPVPLAGPLGFGLEENRLKAPPPVHRVFSQPGPAQGKPGGIPNPGISSNRPPKETSRGDRRTDEGWSKYFLGDNEGKLNDRRSVRSTASSQDTKSDYRSSAWPHVSLDIAPLNLSRLDDPQPLGRVPTGSPSTEHPPNFGNSVVQHGMTAKISRADSVSVASDDEGDRADAFSSGVPASIHDESPWLAMGGPRVSGRTPSSTYSGSMYPISGYTPNLSVPGSSGRPVTQWPSEMDAISLTKRGESDQARPREQMSSDMSWLNLGNNR